MFGFCDWDECGALGRCDGADATEGTSPQRLRCWLLSLCSAKLFAPVKLLLHGAHLNGPALSRRPLEGMLSAIAEFPKPTCLELLSVARFTSTPVDNKINKISSKVELLVKLAAIN